MRTEKEMFDLILGIAKADERIRAVYMNGSRANPDIEKDEYQDYDIVFVVTGTRPFIENKAWINCFGDIAIVHESNWAEVQLGLDNGTIDFSRRYVWLVLFKDGTRVDLVLETKQDAIKNFTGNKLTVLLLDKDGFLPEIPPPSDKDYHATKPDEDKYIACCSGFWWFLNDVAKGIARDQLPYAMEMYNSFVRYTLNQMIDWYVGVQTGFAVSTGKNGKYYKKYLPEELYGLYAATYSDSDYANLWRAIFSGCELFRKTASKVGDYFGFAYNKQDDDNMMDYLRHRLS